MAEPGKYWSFITAHAGNASMAGSTPSTRTAFLIVDSSLPYRGGRNHTTFLGRPWGPLATVIYKNCWMGGHIHPAGWTAGRVDVAHVLYAEFNSSGPGASAGTRASFSRQLTPQQAQIWNVSSVLRGWLPDTHAHYPAWE